MRNGKTNVQIIYKKKVEYKLNQYLDKMAQDSSKNRTVKVVVLGDIGRSPRMQYHALSLANNGFNVTIISYVDSTPLPELLNNEMISITKLHPLEINTGPKLIRYAIKAFWQAVSLFLTLCISGKCDVLLCQNPPAIPTLPICRFYCLITRAKFIIDWHNYAYSIMALSIGKDHLLIKVSRWIEKYFGQSSNKNLCVTYAMKEDLSKNWFISAKVLYDRPPKIFHQLSTEEKHHWFQKLSKEHPVFSDNKEFGSDKTTFTEVVNGNVVMRKGRPGLLFSSTSWTADEDFGVLLTALQIYETTYEMTNKLPKLICVITGKGPMKEHYIQQIEARSWKHVKVITPWLEAADYPRMVGSADLGVCLHTSSSGLDLPMKVVDMFGAGLPVCAYDFKCLNELVKDGVNGYTFRGNDDLAKQIIGWFEDFPDNQKQNAIAQSMRENIAQFANSRWEDNWNLRVKNFFI